MTAEADNAARADTAPVDEYIAAHGMVQAIQAERVASLLMTYRCTLACAHCLFNCGPRQPRRYHSVEQGVRYLRMLHETDRVIHIAGGEAMMEYETVLAICREASGCGAAPHFIETNATWCTNIALVRRRLTELRETGVRGLYVSADPFHLASFPVDRYLRCYEVAVELFGEENVMAPKATRHELREMQEIGRDPERLAEFVRESPPQMVGRAGEVLAKLLPPRAIAEFGADRLWQGKPEGMSCAREFDPETMWEIHIDPYGNIQTCCGVIVGNGRLTPLPELLAEGFAEDNPIVAALCEEGPVGLLRMAEALGYERGEYVQKCHLCWQVRRFLRPHFPEVLGPDEIYGPKPDS
jgi:MoaA/NifB/PqqE/SkfB family radical SAM enzyme